MSDQQNSSVPHVRAVLRALDVLNAFANKGLLSLAQVSSATGLDKGTTRRLLLTLIQRDFVSQDSATGQYRLGRAIRTLAANIQHAQDLRATAQPHLLELAKRLSVTAFLSVLRDGQAVCIDRIHDMGGIEVHWWAVGGTLPLNCGGAPKLLLAFQDPPDIDRLMEREMERLSSESILDRKALAARLAHIRRRGWECAVDDVMLGLTAVAVPVLGADDKPVCAISIAGLTPQMITGKKPAHLRDLQETATRIAEQLGLRKPS